LPSAIFKAKNQRVEEGDRIVSKLEDALAELGKDARLRAQTVKTLLHIEDQLARPDYDVRERVTGPIIDALHRDLGLLEKRLKNGLVFNFRYSGKIARDFVMSADDEPDHVWEPQTTKLLLHLSARARHVVIAGAYAGDQALLVSKQLEKTAGICHCFEPNREQLAVLRRNAQVNSLEKHMVINGVGLWEREGTLQLIGDDAYGRSASDEREDNGVQIDVTSMNAYGARNALEAIDLLMLDVEGGEHAILRGASDYLSQPAGTAPNVVFEIHSSYVNWDNGLDSTNIGQLLRGHGYKLFAVRDYQSNVPMAGLPIELVDTASVYLKGPPHGFNMVAVKDEAVLQGPSFRVCPGVSPKLLRHRDPRLHQPLAI
jgi:FkbM family methyltransferase